MNVVSVCKNTVEGSTGGLGLLGYTSWVVVVSVGKMSKNIVLCRKFFFKYHVSVNYSVVPYL